MTGSQPARADQHARVIEQRGPWPFVTRRIFRLEDETERVWSSRHHRKGLLVGGLPPEARVVSILLRSLWMPRQLNWWIGVIFALGSFLFALASMLSLSPAFADTWSLKANQINAIFFAGSIPFTIAAYLQLFQAANVGEFQPAGQKLVTPFHLFGWRPSDIGWLSCALQFVGTILFNFNTFDAMLPSLGWFQEDLLIWTPNFVGSILFLASGHLAFIETCHAHWAWNTGSLSWWVVFTNLLGCIGFMISASFAIYLPTATPEATIISIAFTLIGAIGFLVGSLLMLPEAVASQPEREFVETSRNT